MFCVKYRKKLLSRSHIADTTKETIQKYIEEQG